MGCRVVMVPVILALGRQKHEVRTICCLGYIHKVQDSLKIQEALSQKQNNQPKELTGNLGYQLRDMIWAVKKLGMQALEPELEP